MVSETSPSSVAGSWIPNRSPNWRRNRCARRVEARARHGRRQIPRRSRRQPHEARDARGALPGDLHGVPEARLQPCRRRGRRRIDGGRCPGATRRCQRHHEQGSEPASRDHRCLHPRWQFEPPVGSCPVRRPQRPREPAGGAPEPAGAAAERRRLQGTRSKPACPLGESAASPVRGLEVCHREGRSRQRGGERQPERPSCHLPLYGSLSSCLWSLIFGLRTSGFGLRYELRGISLRRRASSRSWCRRRRPGAGSPRRGRPGCRTPRAART